MVLLNLIDSFRPTFYWTAPYFSSRNTFFTWFLGYHILTSLPISKLWWILLIFLTLSWPTPEPALQIFLPASLNIITLDPNLYSQASLYSEFPVFQSNCLLDISIWCGFLNIRPQKIKPLIFTPYDSYLSLSFSVNGYLLFLITQNLEIISTSSSHSLPDPSDLAAAKMSITVLFIKMENPTVI